MLTTVLTIIGLIVVIGIVLNYLNQYIWIWDRPKSMIGRFLYTTRNSWSVQSDLIDDETKERKHETL